MVHHIIAKRQKVDEMETGEEVVLFNSDTLSKIITYLPSVDLLNLALTSKRFGVSTNNNDEQSLIEKSTYVAVQEIGTEEQLAALPHYEGESSLADFHYLQLMREPLSFDQLVGDIEYVNSGDKSCVFHNDSVTWGTAFSNNILRAGKHYMSLDFNSKYNFFFVGVMRPGKANQYASGYPVLKLFYQNFSPSIEYNNNNDIKCCLYYTHNGYCYPRDWEDFDEDSERGRFPIHDRWEGMESMSSGDELGMLLDLDEGTLSVYKNSRKLGVMKRGLAGPYCWVVSMHTGGAQVTIKRGTIPPN